MTVKALIFDYKVLLNRPDPEIGALLAWAQSSGLRWCLFSTDLLTDRQAGAYVAAGYPPPDLYVTQDDIPSGKRRGSPDWVNVVVSRLAVVRHELLYVGCTALDWRSAINAGVFYMHAGWAAAMPGGTTSLVSDSPRDVRRILESFLLNAPRWSYSADGDDWSLRSLLPASAELPCTSPGLTFKLQDVFTYERPVRIGGNDARSHLMLCVLANAYLEGLLAGNSYFCVYPGSKRGRLSQQLSGYIDKAAAIVHGYYREDLLVRGSDAPDTSLVRYRARRDGVRADVSIATQATTVHLGPSYQGRLTGKTVIVFDDFTTQGMSLEWARLLLRAGGAQRTVLLTVGKYGATHTSFDLRDGRHINPYAPNADLTAADFLQKEQGIRVDHGVSVYYGQKLSTFIAESDPE
jgi:hypothetical protein